MTDALAVLIAVVVAALAGYRLARLVAVDSITESLRVRLSEWAYRTPEPPEEPPGKLTRGMRGRRYIYELLSCVHCVGVWITIPLSLVLSCQLIDASWIVHLAIAVAAAGLESYMASRAEAG